MGFSSPGLASRAGRTGRGTINGDAVGHNGIFGHVGTNAGVKCLARSADSLW